MRTRKLKKTTAVVSILTIALGCLGTTPALAATLPNIATVNAVANLTGSVEAETPFAVEWDDVHPAVLAAYEGDKTALNDISPVDASSTSQTPTDENGRTFITWSAGELHASGWVAAEDVDAFTAFVNDILLTINAPAETTDTSPGDNADAETDVQEAEENASEQQPDVTVNPDTAPVAEETSSTEVTFITEPEVPVFTPDGTASKAPNTVCVNPLVSELMDTTYEKCQSLPSGEWGTGETAPTINRVLGNGESVGDFKAISSVVPEGGTIQPAVTETHPYDASFIVLPSPVEATPLIAQTIVDLPTDRIVKDFDVVMLANTHGGEGVTNLVAEGSKAQVVNVTPIGVGRYAVDFIVEPTWVKTANALTTAYGYDFTLYGVGTVASFAGEGEEDFTFGYRLNYSSPEFANIEWMTDDITCSEPMCAGVMGYDLNFEMAVVSAPEDNTPEPQKPTDDDYPFCDETMEALVVGLDCGEDEKEEPKKEKEEPKETKEEPRGPKIDTGGDYTPEAESADAEVVAAPSAPEQETRTLGLSVSMLLIALGIAALVVVIRKDPLGNE